MKKRLFLLAGIFLYFAINHFNVNFPLPNPIFPSQAEVSTEFISEANTRLTPDAYQWVFSEENKEKLNRFETYFMGVMTSKPRIITDISLRVLLLALYLFAFIGLVFYRKSFTYQLILVTLFVRCFERIFIAYTYYVGFIKAAQVVDGAYPVFSLDNYGLFIFVVIDIAVALFIFWGVKRQKTRAIFFSNINSKIT